MASIVGGSAANERLNTNYVKSLTYNIDITAVSGTPTVATIKAPGVGSDAVCVMADGAGTIVTAATFDVTVTGANPKIGLEFKDTSITANAELLGIEGVIVATSGSGNAAAGDTVWGGPADLLKASAGVGLAVYFHLGSGSVANSGKIDQAAGTVSLVLTVTYMDR
jgi:hypothetical protein